MPATLRPPRRNFSRRSIKNMDPDRNLPSPPPPPPPPPPVTLLHVVSVTAPAGMAPNVTRWLFDRDIANPPARPLTLTVNGAAPVGMTPLGPRTLELAYPLLASAGHWACPADAANVASVDGCKLAAASGTVA